MNPVLRTEVSSGRPPMPLHLLLILLGRKLLISKRYSRDSSYSRLVTTNKSSCTRGSAGAYARAYKGLALHPAEPAEPAGILFSQWDTGRRLAAAHPATCWPNHHFIMAAHSSFATVPDRIWLILRNSLDGCAIEPLYAATITSKVTPPVPPFPCGTRTRLCGRPKYFTNTPPNPLTTCRTHSRNSRHSVGSRSTRAVHRRVGSLLV
jgi:hypothetical protein